MTISALNGSFTFCPPRHGPLQSPAVLRITSLPGLLLMLTAAPASAHPSIENGMRVIVSRERVTIEARVSLDEVDIAHEIASAGG